jgi:hypothetical protein
MLPTLCSIRLSLGGAAGARGGWSCALCLRLQRESGARRGVDGKGGRTRWGTALGSALILPTLSLATVVPTSDSRLGP